MSSIANTKVSIDQLVLKTLYYRYKLFITPVSTIGVCLILCWVVVLPQVQNWFSMRGDIETDTAKVATLQQNINAVTLIDDTKLDGLLKVASNALPVDKDFASIVTAISDAAGRSGTALGDYNFQIGDIAGTDSTVKGQQLPLQLSITLKGTMDDTQRFMQQLKRELPLSDVISVAANTNQTVTVIAVFYYAPLPKITFNDTAPLKIFTAKEEQLLTSLTAAAVVPVASFSAQPTPTGVTPSPFATPTVIPTTTASPSATPTGTK